MVLVAVAIGVAWTYSVAATFFIAGDIFSSPSAPGPTSPSRPPTWCSTRSR
jgi:hypothetical protein